MDMSSKLLKFKARNRFSGKQASQMVNWYGIGNVFISTSTSIRVCAASYM